MDANNIDGDDVIGLLLKTYESDKDRGTINNRRY